jgi:hypothetical protein
MIGPAGAGSGPPSCNSTARDEEDAPFSPSGELTGTPSGKGEQLMLLNGKSTEDADPDSYELSLALSGWLVRISRGGFGRPALEVHGRDGLVDAATASVVGPALLRGARSGRRSGRSWSLAWGQFPPGTSEPKIVFRRGQKIRVIRPILLPDRFWVAETDAVFRSVTVTVGHVWTVGRVTERP